MKSSPTLLLRNVSVPEGRVVDILIRDGTVAHAGAGSHADRIIDASHFIVLPAAVDLHVHMRGGKQAAKEDWESGSRSALAGGVTVVVDQPNTIPPLTTPAAFAARVHDAQEHSLCSFAVNSAVTADTPVTAMWQAGAAAFGETFFAPSSYGEAVDTETLTRVLWDLQKIGARATIHAEEIQPGADQDLVSHAALRPAAGEIRAVRGVQACNSAGASLYFCHLSTRESVMAAHGSVEVTPHHLFLSYENLDAGNTLGKMNPPLRSEKERRELWSVWDRIDAVASDHAPHTLAEKRVPFASAPSGVPGVETMVPLLMAKVLEKKLALPDVIAKTSANPSRILGIPAAGFRPGDRADFSLYPKQAGAVEGDRLHSRCGWTPFEGMPAVFPEIVILGGIVVYDHGEFMRGSPQWFPGSGYTAP